VLAKLKLVGLSETAAAATPTPVIAIDCGAHDVESVMARTFAPDCSQ
jgi:hypothetical protein